MADRKKLMIPLVAVLIAVIGYIGFVYVRQTASSYEGNFVFYGTAEAEQIDVSAEVSGKIKEIMVQEGLKVEAGSLLAIIDSPENSIRVEQSELSVESAENELARTEEGSREEEINVQKALVKQAEAGVRQAEALVVQAEQGLITAQENYELKKKQYDDIKVLFDNGAVSEEDLENAEHAMNTSFNSLKSSEAQLEAAKAQVENARSQLAASAEKLRLLINGATERSIAASRYMVAQAEKSLDLAKLALDKGKVLAAKGGIIETINFNEGEYVSVGSPVMTITDPSNLWVKIYVPERVLPELKPGKPVSIRCDYLKGKEIKGQIAYISPEAEFTPLNMVTKEDRMKLVFAVKVKILDNLDSIKPGMLLDVNIK